ncbi:type I restriction enzyme, S subunit [Mesorhizobium sp. NFR06]|uniref:restriction endonuclease subunit S n=1 Tax=Mesorhizobium sp. NFR06 TaxID=1566290 RepID=UPI0008EF4F71|nr:restriction endonuclease subunit S [Mesorhizobium sp. NFR06]SFP14541.1 type I restriction enzyme, S subunit [Mesorhizobium sp. NFR06]
MSEMRWEVPSTWAWASIGELAEVVGGGTPSTGDDSNFAQHGIPWLTPADLTGYQDVYISRGRRDLSERGYRVSAARIMPAGTVLFSSRAPIGYCAIADGEISTNQGFKSFVLKSGLSPEYLRHYLLGSVDYAESKASGTTFKELSGSRAAELAVPVAPIPEQRRIVAKIDNLTGKSRRARDHLDHIPRLVEKYKQAVLASAFRGELTRGWSEEGRIAYDDRGIDGRLTNLSVLPIGWSWTSMGAVAAISGGLTKNASRNSLPLRVPYLRVANVYANELRLAEVTEIGCTKAEYQRTLLQPGDLLIVEGNGSLDQIGRVALWTGERPGCAHQNHLIRARMGADVMPPYALFWLLSPQGRNSIETVASSSSGLHTLSISKVGGLPIPICSKEQQEEIVRRIDVAFKWIDRLATQVTSARGLIDHLDRSVLAKAFRGELVPQDPADEPADVLLDRIRAGRHLRLSLKKSSGRILTS